MTNRDRPDRSLERIADEKVHRATLFFRSFRSRLATHTGHAKTWVLPSKNWPAFLAAFGVVFTIFYMMTNEYMNNISNKRSIAGLREEAPNGQADLENPCGTVCVSLISRFCGSKRSLKECNEILRPDALGRSSVADLLRVLREFDLQAEAIRLPIDRLREVALPSILHDSRGHYVVLFKNRHDAHVILDPPRQPLLFDSTSVDLELSGVLVLCSRTNEEMSVQLRTLGIPK